MTIKEFANEVATMVGNDTQVNEVVKNGVPFTCVSVPRPSTASGNKVCANVYLNKPFEDGMSVSDAAELVRKSLVNNPYPDFDLSVLDNYEKIKDNLTLRLYKTEKVNDDLASMSAGKYGFDDLSVVPTIILNADKDGTSSIQVRNDMLSSWGIDIETVVEDAINAMLEHVTFRGITEVLREMAPNNADMFPEFEEDAMYVVSNDTNVYGAAGIICIREVIANTFPEGYYVLPSSLHEVLVIPARRGMSEAELTSMVNEVNSTQVAPEEVLSDHAYVFKGKEEEKVS